MRRNLVLVRLGRAPPQHARTRRAGGPSNLPRTARMGRANLAIFQNKNLAAPVHRVIGKAGKPNPESNEVAQGNQPQMLPERAVMNNVNTHFDSDGGAEYDGGGQNWPGPPTEGRKEHGEDRPGQGEGQQQADVAKAA